MQPALQWSQVRRVVVFRALVLGDLLCATPALRALRAALPQAQITLVGLPAVRTLAERLHSIDDFVEFPGWPGLPERQLSSVRALPPFIQSLRRRRFDLALQLHGSGGIVNPLVAAFGARRNAGFFEPTAWRPAADAALYARWPTAGTEVERLLALTDHLGMARQGTGLDFPLQGTDREGACALLQRARGGDAAAMPGVAAAAADRRPDGRAGARAGGPADAPQQTTTAQPRHVIVHPGSQLPSRRWPPERFAAVADALASRGLTVLLTGTAGEAPLTAAVAAAMSSRPIDLTAATDLWTLGALIESAAVLVCNDTGVSHVAAALGTPSVVVSSGGDALRWQPHERALHRVFWHDIACRPCAHAVCPIGDACARAVTVDGVVKAALAAALPALATSPASPGSIAAAAAAQALEETLVV